MSVNEILGESEGAGPFQFQPVPAGRDALIDHFPCGRREGLVVQQQGRGFAQAPDVESGLCSELLVGHSRSHLAQIRIVGIDLLQLLYRFERLGIRFFVHVEVVHALDP